MKISIVTVAFNAEKTIRDTINSVLSQKGVDLEYVIIDGKSTDQTVPIIQEFKNQIDQFVSEADQGIYDGMNKGVKLAKGDIIGILNSDDFYWDDKVLQKVTHLFEDETVDGVYADLVYVDAADTNKITRAWKSGDYKKGAFKKGWMPPHPTFFVRKQVYEKYGAYSLDLKSAADYEFMLRTIHKHEIKIAYLPEIIVKMRAGGVSNASLKNRLKANREDRMAWKMNKLKPSMWTFIRKPLSKVGQFFKK